MTSDFDDILPPEDTAAPDNSFPRGSVAEGLERLRARLLDLTNRNRLLNYRHPRASCLRVVNTDFQSVFARLMKGAKLPFEPVPEPLPNESLHEYFEEQSKSAPSKPPSKDYAAALGWNTSFDLIPEADTDADSESDSDVTLPVLHFLEGLESITRKIGTAAKTSIEESGTNMLFLVFGFLEWYEDDNSQLPRLAPLLTVPVTLERNVGRSGFECSIEILGDDPINNLSLTELMRKDFAIEIPVIEESDTPDDYFRQFEPIFQHKPRWRIRRQITLTLLSFGKFLMYRDLDPEVYPGICTHPLVKDLFESAPTEELTRAEEYDIDAPQVKDSVPLILDADSSQHSALIDALRGRNLVIEGPPGTGKSQTITNLIAAALANGKTVLFVAEKLAALEVVRRRLDDAGLGMFCLELHSHKTKKQTLISDLQDRLNAKGSFREPQDLKNQLAIVEEKKRHLVRYADTINKRLPGHDSSIFDTLWARERSFLDLPFTGEIRGIITDIAKYDRLRYLEKRHLLSVYAAHLSTVLQTSPEIEKHPWQWITSPLGFEDIEVVYETMDGLISTLAELRSQAEHLSTVRKLPCAFALAEVEKTTDYLHVLPGTPTGLDGNLVGCCRIRSDRESLRHLVSDLSALAKARAQIALIVGDSRIPPKADELDSLTDVYDSLSALGLSEITMVQMREILEAGTSMERALADIDRSFERFQILLECGVPRNSEGVELLLGFVRLLAVAPFESLHVRFENLEADGACTTVRNAAAEGRTLSKQHDELNLDVNVALANERFTPAELDDYARHIEDAGLLARIFGSDYRKAKAVYSRIAHDRKKVRRETMSSALRRLAENTRQCQAFASRSAFAQVLGIHFNGIRSDWDALSSLADWYEEVFTVLPEHCSEAIPLRQLLLRGRTERLKSLKNISHSESTHIERLDRIRTLLPTLIESTGETLTHDAMAGLFVAVKSRNATIAGLITKLETIGVDETNSLKAVSAFISAGKGYLQAEGRISSNQRARDLLGERFSGTSTDSSSIEDAISFAERVVATRLPDAVVAWVLDPEFDTHVALLRQELSDLGRNRTRLVQMCETLDTAAGSTYSKSICSSPLSQLEAVLTQALESREKIEEWSQFLRAKEDAGKAGLGKIAGIAEGKTLPPEHLVPAFDFLFYNSLSKSVFDQHPILSAFSGKTQDAIRRQFADADKASIRLNRQSIAAKIDQRIVPGGTRGAQVKSLTELSLLTHVLHHPQSRVKIRQLIGRAGKALQALKPCFMMGPLSVAQYLPLGDLKFDLIVMDEASQLRPEDAVGAIARGAQIVIVGDPMQLPPTNFFQRMMQSSNADQSDAEQTVVDEGESILDVASTIYQPLRRLRWHYRSRHHSLIAVSNSLFYKDLIIFPSAYHEQDGLGVKYHSVHGGICENSRNPREAETIVSAILQHMRERPDETLGVVALNLEQCELIEELLEKRLRLDPFATAYQERMNSGSEPFFVKNLENVQGDERDVIFISVTYGPDSAGNFYQRFGPINGANGHRRLNVLFTRAKMRVEVFSSFNPDSIRTDSHSQPGLHALKTYLNYARTGVLSSVDDQPNDQPTNDFEHSVGRILTEAGYSVVPQVGVAGFFIDLAVKHPTLPGKYLVGIECDGVAYHSGRSARDRDRLRQEILVNLGWKIHRIWSTDWFRNRGAEKARLLDGIKSLLAGDPTHRAQMSDFDRAKALRQELIKLRDTEIARSFPDAPKGACLLRDDLLDRFVVRKPKTKNDWFRLFSAETRTSIDSRQVGQYIEAVLEIIQRFDSH